jgi:hypothetical protein
MQYGWPMQYSISSLVTCCAMLDAWQLVCNWICSSRACSVGASNQLRQFKCWFHFFDNNVQQKAMEGCSSLQLTKCGGLRIYSWVLIVVDLCNKYVFYMSFWYWVRRTNVAYLILCRIFVVVTEDIHKSDGRVAQIIFGLVSGRVARTIHPSCDEVGPNCLQAGQGKFLRFQSLRTSFCATVKSA